MDKQQFSLKPTQEISTADERVSSAKAHYERFEKLGMVFAEFNTGELVKALAMANSTLIERRKEDAKKSDNYKPKTYFSLECGLQAFGKVLDGTPYSEAITQAAKECDELTDNQIKEAKKLKYFYVIDVVSHYDEQINTLIKQGYTSRVVLKRCTSLVGLLKVVQAAVVLKCKVEGLIDKVKDLEVKLDVANSQITALNLTGVKYPSSDLSTLCKAEKLIIAKDLKSQGRTNVHIAHTLGVDRKTVSSWLK